MYNYFRINFRINAAVQYPYDAITKLTDKGYAANLIAEFYSTPIFCILRSQKKVQLFLNHFKTVMS